MPRSNGDKHFKEERPEWTKRKHQVLGSCVVPTAMKLKQYGKTVALIDGYSGSNKYGAEEIGSTSIMVTAAQKVISQNSNAVVYACEPNKRRYQELTANLQSHIESGLLVTYQTTHSEAVSEIQKAIGNSPAMVFLDPFTVSQMTIKEDIEPWARRPVTDVLGVFFAGQACRICGQVASGDTSQRVAPSAFLGDGWETGTTDDSAYDVFFSNIKSFKQFTGLYRMRKLDRMQDAYGLFGLSDHEDGFWLLSNAVAKDHGKLKDYDYKKKDDRSLFEDYNGQAEFEAAFEKLKEIARPVIVQNPSLRGAKLASFLFKNGIGVEELFGNYEERDFTSAVYDVLGLPDRRKKIAKS